jgi:AcrR family transcriptional regulator
MASERSGGGDPVRTLELLWRREGRAPRRGPRPGLSIDAVVATATGLADADGLDAVTMRRVAGELGVAPMTLYTYVPGKAELLDLMLDAAYAAMPRTETEGRPWRERLSAVAEENRALYERHPWAAEISTVRPPLGPGMSVKYEHELAALEGLGLDDVEMDAALTYLLAFVQGWARSAAEARAQRPDGATGDERWWETAGPALERLIDPARYPIATRVGAAAGAAHGAAYGPRHAYEFGLARVLDGLGALIERRSGGAG